MTRAKHSLFNVSLLTYSLNIMGVYTSNGSIIKITIYILW